MKSLIMLMDEADDVEDWGEGERKKDEQTVYDDGDDYDEDCQNDTPESKGEI